MGVELQCDWMSIKLDSPIVVTSITPLSHAEISAHVHFFERAAECGAGALVLPSINPTRHGQPGFNQELVDTLSVDTGLRGHGPMAFAVLGPTVPNIVSVEYGLRLAEQATLRLRGIPIIASVACMGTLQQIGDVVGELEKLGISGFELNFSCPNVKTGSGDDGCTEVSVVHHVRRITRRPISAKLPPQHDYHDLICRQHDVPDGLTLTNAYIGLAPPSVDGMRMSPFQKSDAWAPGGVYGPFERLLTFYELVRLRESEYSQGLSVACVGGMVAEEDPVQSLLLGADVVQVSSGIAWNGLRVIGGMNRAVKGYLEKMGLSRVSDIRGLALPQIWRSADDVGPGIARRKARVNFLKCRGCLPCGCTEHLCLAMSQEGGERVRIDPRLCSGCGWCVSLCRFHAISLES